MRIKQLADTLNLEVPKAAKAAVAQEGSLKGAKVKDSAGGTDVSHYEALKKDTSKEGVPGYSMRELKLVNARFNRAFDNKPELLKAWHDLKTPLLQTGADYVTPDEFLHLVDIASRSRDNVPNYDKLNVAQKVAVILYELDADYYRTLNRQLREDGFSHQGWQYLEAHLKDAIKVLDNQATLVTYRGVTEAPGLTALKRGDEYHNKDFLSSSKFVEVTSRYVHSDTYLADYEIDKTTLPPADTTDDNLLVMVGGQKATISEEEGERNSEELIMPKQDWKVELNVRHPHPDTGRDVNWVVMGGLEGGHQEGLIDALDLAKK